MFLIAVSRVYYCSTSIPSCPIPTSPRQSQSFRMSWAMRGRHPRGRRAKGGACGRRDRFEVSRDSASSTLGQEVEEEALSQLSLEGGLWQEVFWIFWQTGSYVSLKMLIMWIPCLYFCLASNVLASYHAKD